MKIVHIYKAQSAIKDTESAKIILTKTIPNFLMAKGEPEFKWRKRATETYKEEAVALHKILLSTLPGGTYDQLLSEMMRNKASVFQVSFIGDEK